MLETAANLCDEEEYLLYGRRHFLRMALGATLSSVGGCAAQGRSLLRCPTTLADFEPVNDLGPLRVYRCKNGSGPAIVLLHELPGMSPSNLALARCLSGEGFAVYLPLLFGEPEQERFLVGYFQSCAQSEFQCSALSTSSPIIGKLREVCGRIVDRTRRPVAVIGMCLTGAFPLALLGDGVEAAVLCQPTLPLNVLLMRPIGKQKEALGLSEDDINRAKKVKTPLLALRYQTDHLCPKERMKTLREIFQLRVAMIEIDGESQGHSTLADHFDDRAFMDSVNFLKVRLGLERSAKRMNLAKLGDRACEITVDGHWRAL